MGGMAGDGGSGRKRDLRREGRAAVGVDLAHGAARSALRVQGLRSRSFWASGFGGWGLGFMFGFRFWGLGFRFGFRFWVSGRGVQARSAAPGDRRRAAPLAGSAAAASRAQPSPPRGGHAGTHIGPAARRDGIHASMHLCIMHASGAPGAWRRRSPRCSARPRPPPRARPRRTRPARTDRPRVRLVRGEGRDVSS